MARAAQSRRRNIRGFGWLTKKKETYRRDVRGERAEMIRKAKAEKTARARDARQREKHRRAEERERLRMSELRRVGSYKGITVYKIGTTGRYATSIDESYKHSSLADTKRWIDWYLDKKSGNPCARTVKSEVTDRAKRYRANQPGCRPSGVKKCKLCGSRSDVMVDHTDGNESNGRKSNLRWLCRSCNNTLGAEMARTGEGRRTVQYNPEHKGALTLGEYMQAVLQHTRGHHDAAGKIIHDTPKSRRRAFASEIWARRESHGTTRPGSGRTGQDEPDWVTNPADSAAQYRLAQAVLSGTARDMRMSKKAAREIVDRTPARLRSEYSKNPGAESSTEYRLGYNLGQMDRQNAAMPKTWAELEATFNANFPAGTRTSALPFFQAYQDGYSLGRAQGGESDADGQRGANPAKWWDRKSQHTKFVASRQHQEGFAIGVKDRRAGEPPKGDRWLIDEWERRYPDLPPYQREAFRSGYNKGYFESLKGGPKGRLPNPEPADHPEEYQQAKRIAELFHGRVVKEEIEIHDAVHTHDWYAELGPMIELRVKGLRGYPYRTAKFKFSIKGDALIHMLTSPDGRQFYLRGGDQELDLKPLGMEKGTEWFRHLMSIGEVTYFVYRDGKKFHGFKITDYSHKVGSGLDSSGTRHVQNTNVRPVMIYDTLSKKISFAGGLGKVETENLVDGMSPGIVN